MATTAEQRDKECCVCFHPWDTNRHEPRTLPCGHPLCWQCLLGPGPNVKATCPLCRALLPTNRAALPVDYSLLRGAAGAPASRSTTTTVYVKTMTGTTISLQVSPQRDTVKQLKLLVQERTGTPAENLRLRGPKGLMADDSATLSSYGIGRDTTVSIVLRLRGGVNAETY